MRHEGFFLKERRTKKKTKRRVCGAQMESLNPSRSADVT